MESIFGFIKYKITFQRGLWKITLEKRPLKITPEKWSLKNDPWKMSINWWKSSLNWCKNGDNWKEMESSFGFVKYKIKFERSLWNNRSTFWTQNPIFSSIFLTKLWLTPFFRMDPLLYHKFDYMVIFRLHPKTADNQHFQKLFIFNFCHQKRSK